MALIADILLVAGALGAAVYCLVLSRRLQQFTRLEDGVGGAIAVLSAQVDDMTRALKEARAAAHSSETALAAQTARAEQATERLSLMLASLHDLPDLRAFPQNASPHVPGPGFGGQYTATPVSAPDTTDAPTRVASPLSPGQSAPGGPAPAAPVTSGAAISAAPPPDAGTPPEPERGPRFLRRRPALPGASVPMTTPQPLCPEAAE